MTITDGTWLVIFGFCLGFLAGAFVGSLFRAASGEVEGIIAWMPMEVPEPYKEGRK